MSIREVVPISKVRIYEIAKETGLSNKAVLARLADMGIEAKSHSSSIDAADAKALVEGLGKERAKRQAKVEVDTKAEAEQYNLEDLSRSKEAKANRIVPPHLRGGGAPAPEEAPQAAAHPAAPPAAAPVAPAQSADSGAARPATAPVQAFRPAPAQAASSDALDEAPEAAAPQAERPADAPAPGQRPGSAPPAAGQRPGGAPAPAASAPAAPAQAGKPSPISRPLDPRQAAKIAAAGVVRRADEVAAVRQAPQAHRPVDQTAQSYTGDAAPQQRQPRGDQQPRRQGQGQGQRPAQGAPQGGTPGVPRPGTPPRPGQPTAGQPAPAGAQQQRRRIESNLPREGSGKRHIPPPLKAAPAQPANQGGQGRPGGRPSGDRHPAPQDQRGDGPRMRRW